MGPDGMNPSVLMELVDVIRRPLSLKNPGDGKRFLRPGDKQTPVFKKGKEYPVNYRPVSLTPVPGKMIEQQILEIISR